MKINGISCTSSLDVNQSTLNPEPFDGVKFFDIRCLLHNVCNLRCKFCFETKEKGIRENTKINLDYIKNLPDEVINSVGPVMKKYGKNSVVLGLMGGELFSDNIPDSVFDLYREFLRDLLCKLKEYPIIEFSSYVVSNGIFVNRKRVEDFLREFNMRLILSYDPMDRFNSEYQRSVWYNTFKYFEDIPEVDVHLSILMTKRNIDAYIAGDEIYERVRNNICVVNHEYFPRLDYQGYLPNDDDIFNYYKWAIDNGKFNIAHVSNIIISQLDGRPATTCYQKSDYMFGQGFTEKYGRPYINQCAEDPIDKEYYYGKYADQIIDDTDCLKYKQPLGLQKRGCLMCEYYNYCPKMCWSQIAFDKYEMGECPIGRVYKYIDSNPSILVNFDNWRKLNGKG